MGQHLVPGWAWTYPASGSQVRKDPDRGQDGTARAGRVRDWRDRLPGGLTMFELLLIDVALCAALAMVIASIMVMRRWRRSSGRASIPVSEREAVTEPAGGGVARRERALVPGFSDNTAEPDRDLHAPPEPEQAAQSQVSGAVNPQRGPQQPAAQPDGQQAAAGAATSGERIATYYDEADQPMSDYLAALGWAGKAVRHDPG